MGEYIVGKLLPNVTVSVETINIANDSANVIISDTTSHSNTVEITRPIVETHQNQRIYLNKDGGFTTGLDLIAQENSGILDKRAERFGLDMKENRPSIINLYRSMDIDIENRDSAEMKQIILTALHVRGVQEFNSDEVMEYFQNFGYIPKGVEWVNDYSCNVHWPDEASCARALLNLSTILPASFPITDPTESTKKTEVSDASSSNLNDVNDKNDSKMDIDDSSGHKFPESVDIPVPPGRWRLGVAHSKAKSILLRFATKNDKKVPGAEKRSKYYQIHGNPNYEGLKGIISSSRKRKAHVEANRLAVQKVSSSSNKSFSSHQSDTYPKITNPWNKNKSMYADYEEERKAEKVARSKYHSSQKKSSVHSRLGKRYYKDDLLFLGQKEDSKRNTKDFRAYRDLYGESSYYRAYRDLDNPDDNTYSSNFKLKSRNSREDLRSKLKSRINENKGLYSQSYDEDKDYSHISDTEKFTRTEELKKTSRSIFKRKHRSPMCADEEDDDYQENDTSSEY